jgi:hypothetical protein
MKIVFIRLDREFYMNIAKRSALILAVFAIFASVEIYFHWYAGTQNTSTAHSLKTWYLQRDSYSGKADLRGYTDWDIPAEVLGLAAGIILARSRIWVVELVFWALFLSGGITALYAFDLAFFPENRLEMPQPGIGMTTGLGFAFVIGALHCGLFIAAGRVLTAHLINRKSNKTVESKHDAVV